MKPVLICGGIGKKMWPLSRKKMPKHFLPLFNGKSLYQINYETLRKKFKPEEIYIQTTEDQAENALKQAPGVPRKNCFIEPELRDTGPAMGFMAAKLFAIDPDETFTLVQVDVLREPGDEYLKMIEQIDVMVKKEGKLITGGIRLDYPVMGVDYLRPTGKGKKLNGVKFLKVNKYIDRDVGREKIEELFKQKLVLTHANHNSLTPRLFLEEYKKYAPDWYQPLRKMIDAFGKSNEERVVKEEYAKMKPDRTERVTQHVFDDGYVVELPFKWTDFGTWESLYEYETERGLYKPDENLLEIKTKNCFVKKGPKNFIALIGVQDLAVIDTDDALLVCKIDKAADVQEVVSYLKKKKKVEYL
jgi:mannose-1-phosphate guanylyltransferase